MGAARRDYGRFIFTTNCGIYPYLLYTQGRMTTLTRVTVLISERGSNLKSLLASSPSYGSYKISHIISDNHQAAGLHFAREFQIETTVVQRDKFKTKQDFHQALFDAADKTAPDLICLAGFMHVMQPDFVAHYFGSILNIHPSLLPSYPGLHTHKRVLEAKEKMHGCSVHFVDRGVDTGPVVAQIAIPVLQGDNEESLAARVLEKEHVLYPWVVHNVARREITARARKVTYGAGIAADAAKRGIILSQL